MGKLMGETKHNGGEPRAVETQASSQLTTLTSVLAGFGFAWFALLVDKESPSPLTVVIVVVSALTIFALVLASIVGALLTIASEITARDGPLRRAEVLWVGATKGGLLLFLATVGLLPYRVDPVAGVICSILAAVVAVAVVATWRWIQRFAPRPPLDDLASGHPEHRFRDAGPDPGRRRRGGEEIGEPADGLAKRD
jgi:NhaP-type Na+/H+ or K+/H+ antiporter